MATNFETLILRFRDLVTAERETIEKHLSVIEEHGYVWWAWWKKGNEKTPLEEFAILAVKAKSSPINIFLVDSGQNLAYRATCQDIIIKDGGKLRSPEENKTPEYYRDQEYYAWFKFTNIEPCDKSILNEFAYVDCKSLFCDDNVDYSKFNDKKIYSLAELIQQNRTVWFVRKANELDRHNEIILLNADFIQPSHFSAKYHQSSGDTLIWLSDLHLSDHVFDKKNGKIRKTLGKHILNAIDKQKVAGILISGDITSRAEEAGFSEAQELLKYINSEIPYLNSENIIVCPGNHDFVREPGELARNKEPQFIYEKSENTTGFSNFYRSIYQVSPNKFFASGRKLLLSSGHILEIAALNSLMLQQYANFDGHGYLSAEQLDFVAEHMGWNNNDNKNAIRIVMMHHHYLPTCYTEVIDVTKASSAVYDADRLMNWLVKYNVKLLLHGHKHKSFVSQISYPVAPEQNVTMKDMKHIAIVGMGGTGAAGVENKFATIHFDNHNVTFEIYKVHSDEATADTVCQKVILSLNGE